MNKRVLIMAILCCIALLSGCTTDVDAPSVQEDVTSSTQAEGTQEVSLQLANPVVSVEDALGFAELQITMEVPEGATEVDYSIIGDQVAQIIFQLGEAEFTLRASYTVAPDELHGYYGVLEPVGMGINACGDLFAYTIENYALANDAGTVAIGELTQLEGEPLFFTLSTSQTDYEITAGLLIEVMSQLPWAGAEETDTSVPWTEGTLYAVVNLGYRNYSPWEDVLAQSVERWGLDTPDRYELGGDECYLIIPRYVDTTCSIYEMTFTEMDLEQGALLEECSGGTPFILFCNPSDLYPNHIIHLTCGQDMASFSVSTSLMDGALNEMELGMALGETENN